MAKEKGTKSKIKVELSCENKHINITTPSGDKFEIVVTEDGLNVFSSSSFGSGLMVRPCANNMISLKNVK